MHDPSVGRWYLMRLLLLCGLLTGWNDVGDLESDAQRTRRRSSIAVAAAAAAAADNDDGFKLVVFKIGN